MEGSQQCNILDSYESTENALMDSFKAAALKVTTLYKDSLVQNRKAFASGYQQALQDLYEFISAQPENGFVSVQEVLAFARQKNNQLTSEMGGQSNSSANQSSTATAQSLTSLNNTPVSRSNNQESQMQKMNTSTANVMNNPFQIDPQTQFTFTHDLPQYRSMDGLWNQATAATIINNNDGFKRRMVPNEVSFMGRPVNMETWHEPPFKRGRIRRDEQFQLQQPVHQTQSQLLSQQQQQQQQQQQHQSI